MLERRWDVAGAEFRKAVELSPASLDVYLDYAPYLAIMGRPDESRAALLKAKALDPLSVVAAHALAISFLVYKDYDGAIAEFKRAIALNPNWTWGSIKLGVAFTHKGMCRDALEAATIAEDALRHGDTPLARAWLGYIYGICGLKGRAQDALRQLAKWPASIREDPLKEATVYAGLRDKERVHRLLEQAGEREGGNSLMLVSFPRLFWPDLEREPAFRRIIERVGLPLKLLSPDP